MNIKDYLHLHLGCDCVWEHYPTVQPFKLTIHILYRDESPVKPILRPLSDITEEEKFRYFKTGNSKSVLVNEAQRTKFLLSKHFDLFGLIEKGLAIDATTLVVKTN